MAAHDLLFPSQVTDDYDQLAVDYAAYKQISSDDMHGYNALLKKIGKLDGKLVLDVGCGQGNFSEVVSSLGADVVGVDVSEEMIKKAKANSQHAAHYEVISRAKFPFPSNHFDRAISTFCLCTEADFNDVEENFLETNRVLKPGGLLGIMHVNYLNANGEKFNGHSVERVGNLRHGDPIKVFLGKPSSEALVVQDYYHDMEHYSAALKRQNFQNIKIEDVNIPDGRKPYILIVAQKVA